MAANKGYTMHNAWGSWYLIFFFLIPLSVFGKAAFWLHTKTSLRFVWAVFVETVFIFLGSTIDNPIKICFILFFACSLVMPLLDCK